MTDTPSTWNVQPATGPTKTAVVMVEEGTGNVVPVQALRVNSAQVSSDNPLPVQFSSGPLTPAAGDAHVIVTGGTAVVAFAADSIDTGAYIVNGVNDDESLFVDPVNVPTTSAPGTNGTTVEILPGGRWDAPGPLTTPVRVNAATTAHAFTAVRY